MQAPSAFVGKCFPDRFIFQIRQCIKLSGRGVMFLRLKQQKVLDETRTFCFALKNAVHGTPGGNRTHNGPLGGGCYIHLTTEA